MGNKLILGTAQFGLNYGVANKAGKISLAEGGKILGYAHLHHIRYLDTAIAYGDSESQVGQIQDNRFEIFTKIPAIPDGVSDIREWILSSIISSMNRLRVKKLAGVLLHEPMQVLGPKGGEIIYALRVLKDIGISNMIGYSVYSPDEADLLEKVYKPDMIQIPFNLIDRRILNNDWLLEQKHKNIKIHARSIFLQGLLLLPLDQIPNKFQIWLKIWNTWHQWLQVNSSLPMATCLNFVASNPMIDGLVIGVDNLAHLNEIVGAYDESMPTYIPSISSEDVRLINPSNWNYL